MTAAWAARPHSWERTAKQKKNRSGVTAGHGFASNAAPQGAPMGKESEERRTPACAGVGKVYLGGLGWAGVHSKPGDSLLPYQAPSLGFNPNFPAVLGDGWKCSLQLQDAAPAFQILSSTRALLGRNVTWNRRAMRFILQEPKINSGSADPASRPDPNPAQTRGVLPLISAGPGGGSYSPVAF